MSELEIPQASQVTWFVRDPGGTTTYIAPGTGTVRDRDQPSSLDEAPLDDRFPVRHVALFCDRCGTEIIGDFRADVVEQAYEGLRSIAAVGHGWQITETEDICPGCVS